MGRALSLVYQWQVLFKLGRESDAGATMDAVLPLLKKYGEAVPVRGTGFPRGGGRIKKNDAVLALLLSFFPGNIQKGTVLIIL
jgi:hypothetical protein